MTWVTNGYDIHEDVGSCNGTCRPVVVLDPEDTEAIRELVQHANFYRPGEYITPMVEALRKGLRQLANPKPPKPEEPTGLGAVVEDVDGVLHVRSGFTSGGQDVWRPTSGDDVGYWRRYEQIDVSKVLSDGLPVE